MALPPTFFDQPCNKIFILGGPLHFEFIGLDVVINEEVYVFLQVNLPFRHPGYFLLERKAGMKAWEPFIKRICARASFMFVDTGNHIHLSASLEAMDITFEVKLWEATKMWGNQHSVSNPAIL